MLYNKSISKFYFTINPSSVGLFIHHHWQLYVFSNVFLLCTLECFVISNTHECFVRVFNRTNVYPVLALPQCLMRGIHCTAVCKSKLCSLWCKRTGLKGNKPVVLWNELKSIVCYSRFHICSTCIPMWYAGISYVKSCIYGKYHIWTFIYSWSHNITT